MELMAETLTFKFGGTVVHEVNRLEDIQENEEKHFGRC